MEKSCVQVYTGNGKGKTTAAMGLAIRAAGQGLNVKIVQFLKGRDTGELHIISRIDNIELLRASDSKAFFYMLSDEEKAAMRVRVCDVLKIVDTWLDKADLLIMDEAMAALSCGILTLPELLHIIDRRGRTEVVLTGRDAPEEIINRADLVTEMCEVKHYMDNGVAARKGIEY